MVAPTHGYQQAPQESRPASVRQYSRPCGMGRWASRPAAMSWVRRADSVDRGTPSRAWNSANRVNPQDHP